MAHRTLAQSTAPISMRILRSRCRKVSMWPRAPPRRRALEPSGNARCPRRTAAGHGCLCDSDGNYHVVRLPSLDEFVPRTQSNRQQYHSEGDYETPVQRSPETDSPRTNFARKVFEHHASLAAVRGTAKLRSAVQGKFRKAPG